MKLLVTLSCLVAAAWAKPAVITPYGYSYSTNVVAGQVTPVVASQVTPVVYTPYAYSVPQVAHTVSQVVSQSSQYHVQNDAGQASYGYSQPLQVHNAVQDAAGNKVGYYSYVAPNGQVLSTNYVADALGYRVISNAVPVAPVASVVTTNDKVAEDIAGRRRGRRDVSTVLQHYPVVNSAYYTPASTQYSAYYTPAATQYSAPVVSHVGTPVVSHVGTQIVAGAPVVSTVPVVHTPTTYAIYNGRG